MLKKLSLEEYRAQFPGFQELHPLLVYHHPDYLELFPSLRLFQTSPNNVFICFSYNQFGFWKKIFVPPYNQQHAFIGEWSEHEILQLTQYLKRKWRRVRFQTPRDIQIKGYRKTEKLNLELSLNQEYTFIRQQFSKSHKRKLNQISSRVSFQNEILTPEIKQWIFQKIRSNQWSNSNILNQTERLLNQTTFPFHTYVARKQGQVIGVLAILEHENRLYNFFPYSNEEGKKEQVMYALMNTCFQEFSDKEKIFDFEGSSIPGVYQFYKGFHPKSTPIYLFESN